MSVLYALLVCLPALTYAQTLNLKPYNETATVAFNISDLNHDGVIDKNEMDTIFKHLDSNGDGRIDFHEYGIYLSSGNHDAHTNHVLHALFQAYDVNKDHHIDHVDYELFFSLADGNGDNLLEKNEFVH
ncbi:uncharacterized protein LOC131945942 [Physella acuta]|uniref:uncharacterized protein LOC131945942 n=1 Tax=Physella acuta TaxID=109671 RepID=UPI0027DC5543|nr:uncharacterized protein LOC131945942 [Physella acuta]